MAIAEMPSKKRIRVVHIITGLSTGGAEMMLFKVLSRIDRRRFDPYVISLGGVGEVGVRIQSLGVPVIAMGVQLSIPGLIRVFNLVLVLKRLKPDVVSTWMYHSDLLGGLAARISGVRAILWGVRHSDLSIEANKRTTLWIVRACALLSYYVPKKILINSQFAAKIHESVGYAVEKISVIPNGFDLSQFHPSEDARTSVRSELGLCSSTPLVGVFGRFHPQKNHMGFVSAIAEISTLRPDVRFIMVGQGVDLENNILMSAIHAAGVAGVCHLLGLRTDIPRLMAALDILALPSVGEAFPNVVGEAMACAVPCAVTDVGDTAWVVGHTGRVVPAGDMLSLAVAINNLLCMHREQRAALGAAARKRVSILFEIGAVVKQYEALYDSLGSEVG